VAVERPGSRQGDPTGESHGSGENPAVDPPEERKAGVPGTDSASSHDTDARRRLKEKAKPVVRKP
jgi:hypothetical protein